MALRFRAGSMMSLREAYRVLGALIRAIRTMHPFRKAVSNHSRTEAARFVAQTLFLGLRHCVRCDGSRQGLKPRSETPTPRYKVLQRSGSANQPRTFWGQRLAEELRNLLVLPHQGKHLRIHNVNWRYSGTRVYNQVR